MQAGASDKGDRIQVRDEATLSSESISFSLALAEAREALNTRSAADPNRIADIREQIQAGTYRVSSEDIADSMLGELYG